jgi:hypothetical protein
MYRVITFYQTYMMKKNLLISQVLPARVQVHKVWVPEAAMDTFRSGLGMIRKAQGSDTSEWQAVWQMQEYMPSFEIKYRLYEPRQH